MMVSPGLSRSRFAGILLSALSLLLALTGVAAAQETVSARLEPIGGSGVSGMATVAGTAGGGATVSFQVTGLTPATSYQARLNAGTCAMPSASSGLLGTLTADGSGRAALSTSTVRFSAADAGQDLEFSNLADGDHIFSVVSTSVVACGSIPRSTAAMPSQLPATGGPAPAPAADLLGALGLLTLGFGLLIRRCRSAC